MHYGKDNGFIIDIANLKLRRTVLLYSTQSGLKTQTNDDKYKLNLKLPALLE